MTDALTDSIELEQKLKKIVDFVESLPEQYRMKSFEFLLNRIEKNLVVEDRLIKNDLKNKTSIANEKAIHQTKETISIELKAFLQQFTIDEQKLSKLFFISAKHIAPIYKLPKGDQSKSQVRLTLLTALENSILPESRLKFSCEVEDIRKRCREQNCYNSDHFTRYFKDNEVMFIKTGGKILSLSQDGKEKLAELINLLIKHV